MAPCLPRMNSDQLHSNSPRPKYWILVIVTLILATFVTYLAVGLFYVTSPHGPFPALKLSSAGDSFLSVYPGWNDEEEFDDAAYNRVAIEVLHTGLPRDKHGALFFHAPLYGYFVGACYWIGGIRLLAIAIPQAFVAALTCGAIAVAAFNIAPRAKLGATLFAGILFLINFRFAMYVGYVSPTILLEFFFSLAILAASLPFTRERLIAFVAACLLAMCTQAAFFVVVLATAVWLFWRFFLTGQRILLGAGVVLLLLGSGKAFLPTFLADNSRSSSKAAAQGILWEANNPYYESMGLLSLWERRPGNPWTHWKKSTTEDQRYNEYLQRTNDHQMRAAMLWIRENPLQYAKLTFVRLWTTLGPITGMMSPRNRLISFVIWALIFPAGYYGWWICRQEASSQLAAVVALTLAAFSALVIVEWYLRYRFPVDLLATLYAGIGYAECMTSSRRRNGLMNA
jgi:MFS family permease